MSRRKEETRTRTEYRYTEYKPTEYNNLANRINWTVEEKEPIIVIPRNLDLLIRSLDKVTESEFLVLLKLDERDPLKIVDWYVPEQEVTSASVDVTESISGFDGSIHKHPNGILDFSTTDREYLFGNFKLNILYCNKKYVKAVYIIRNSGYRFECEIPVIAEEESVDVSHVIGRIKKKVYYVTYQNGNYYYPF